VSDGGLCGSGWREGTKKQDGDRKETHAHRSTPILVYHQEIDKIYEEVSALFLSRGDPVSGDFGRGLRLLIDFIGGPRDCGVISATDSY